MIFTNKIKVVAIFAVCFLFTIVSCTSANAAGMRGAGIVGGAYVGVGLGYGQLEAINTPPNLPTNEFSKDEGKFAYRIHIGYLWSLLQSNSLKFGFEAGFNHYPSNDYSLRLTNSAIKWGNKAYGFDLSAVARVNFNNNGPFNVFAKAGLTHIALHNYLDWPGVFDHNQNYFDMGYRVAAGLGYDINRQFSVEAEGSLARAVDIGFDDPWSMLRNLTSPAQAITVLLTLEYHFSSGAADTSNQQADYDQDIGPQEQSSRSSHGKKSSHVRKEGNVITPLPSP